MQQTSQYRQPYFFTGQRGITMIPALAAVALVTIIAVTIDIPQQQKQRQNNQTTANTNTSVQLLSATLSYYNDKDAWPTKLHDLKQYLPIRPSDDDLNNMAKLTGDGDELLFNAQTHTNAKQLAWQFAKLDVAIVDDSGSENSGSEDSVSRTWVKIPLDASKYGQWGDYRIEPFIQSGSPQQKAYSPESAICPRATGKQTQTAKSCTKDWCLGSKVHVKNCSLDPEVVKGTIKYENCDYTRGKQTKNFDCLKGWDGAGNEVDCPTSSGKEVPCNYANWDNGSWGHWSWSGWLVPFILEVKTRSWGVKCLYNTGRLKEKSWNVCDGSKKQQPKYERCWQTPIGFFIYDYVWTCRTYE